MVYEELKIVWQTVKRARRAKDPMRQIEFLEFLALEGGSLRMRQAAMQYYLETATANQATKSFHAAASE